MRAFLVFVVLSTLPLAAAQTAEREVEQIVIDGGGATRVLQFRVAPDTTDDPRRIEIRLDSLVERVGGLFGPDGVIGSRMGRLQIEMEDGTLRVQTDADGVDPETAIRMRRLQSDARRLADDARGGDRQAERRLDGVLEELFEVRGEMRHARAESLRERAAELHAQADELDAEARRREQDRGRLIEERKRELMRDGARSDW